MMFKYTFKKNNLEYFIRIRKAYKKDFFHYSVRFPNNYIMIAGCTIGKEYKNKNDVLDFIKNKI